MAYEGQRYSVGSTYQTSVPVTCAGGSAGCGLTSPSTSESLVDACNAVGRAHVSALSAVISGLPAGSCEPSPPNYNPGLSESFFPTNMGTGPFGAENIVLGLVSTNHQDNGVAKVDYHSNDKNTLTGMYFKGQGGGIWNDGAYQVGLPGTNSSPWMSNLFGSIQMAEGPGPGLPIPA